MKQGLAADGEPDATNPALPHIGPALQEGDGGLEVSGGSPAEGVRIAIALALAATVEEQDAVAVTHEYSRRPLRARPSGCCDHRGAVS